MQWTDIAGAVGKFAPLVGTLLGGPAGGAVGGLVASALGVESTPDAVSQALATSPDAAVKIAEIQATQAAKLQELLVTAEQNRLAAETAQLQAVNATMQAEAKSEKWPQYSWRPFNGFVVGTMAFGVYFVLPLVKVPVPAIPESVWVMFGAILGVASWFRGQAKVQQTKGA